MPLINTYADISNGAIGLIFGLSLYLYPYFVYVINEGSGKSAQMIRLACTLLLTDTLSTVKPLSKWPKFVFQDYLSLNAGQKYCRMLHGEHSAILLTYIKLPLVVKTFVLSIFEWSLYTGITVPKSHERAYM